MKGNAWPLSFFIFEDWHVSDFFNVEIVDFSVAKVVDFESLKLLFNSWVIIYYFVTCTSSLYFSLISIDELVNFRLSQSFSCI